MLLCEDGLLARLDSYITGGWLDRQTEQQADLPSVALDVTNKVHPL